MIDGLHERKLTLGDWSSNVSTAHSCRSPTENLPGFSSLVDPAETPGAPLTCHLYYTFDEHEVVVRAVWGARRRRDPSLKP